MPKIYSQQFKGECVSKANSRRLPNLSKDAALKAQAKRIEPLLEGDL